MARLDFGSGDPEGVLSGTANFFASGGKPATVLLASVFGVVVSIAQGGINVLQSIFNLIAQPLDAGGVAIATAFEATIVEPLQVLISGAGVSADSLDTFGFIALPVGVALLLGSYWLIVQYLEEDETSDTVVVPGFPDLPFFGVEEEDEQ